MTVFLTELQSLLYLSLPSSQRSTHKKGEPRQPCRAITQNDLVYDTYRDFPTQIPAGTAVISQLVKTDCAIGLRDLRH
jgi:hypothetical protein